MTARKAGSMGTTLVGPAAHDERVGRLEHLHRVRVELVVHVPPLACWRAPSTLAGGRPAPSPRCGSRRIVAAFERARATGRERALVDGGLIDVPIYAAAKRLLATVDDR